MATKLPLYMELTNPKQAQPPPPKVSTPMPTVHKCHSSILEEPESEEDSISPIAHRSPPSSATPNQEPLPFNFNLTNTSKAPSNRTVKLEYTPSPPIQSGIIMDVKWSESQQSPPLRRALNFDESPPAPARLTFNETPIRSSAHHYLTGEEKEAYQHSQGQEMSPNSYTDERLKRELRSLEIDRQLQILNQTQELSRQVATEGRSKLRGRQKVEVHPNHRTQLSFN